MALAIVTLFALLALGMTIAAWRARRTTPRRVSLIFSVASCIAIVLAAIDLSIPLPTALCSVELFVKDNGLEAALEDGLERWDWWWRPCRRLNVTVSPEALATPVDFAKLAGIAARRGIAVDVTLGASLALRGEQLALFRGDRRLPISIPVPASQLDVIVPKLGDRPAVPLVCRIDQRGEAAAGATLFELLTRGGGPGSYSGFHLVQCRAPDLREASTRSAYIHVTTNGVVVASEARFAAQFAEQPPESSFGLPRELLTVREQDASLDTASMVVLDRPAQPSSCGRAKALLERGATVVLTMPGDGFLAACDWLPLASARTNKTGQAILFDRRPRITYIPDDFAEKLTRAPACVFQSKVPCAAGNPSAIGLPDGRGLQSAAAKTSKDLLSAPGGVGSNTELQEAPIDKRSDDFVARIWLERDPPSEEERRRDDLRLARSSPVSALAELTAAAVTNETRVYWENEVVVAFTYDRRALDDKYLRPFLEGGSRLYIAEVKDPYGESLKNLYPQVLDPPVDPSVSLLASTHEMRIKRGDASRCGGDLERCLQSGTLDLSPFKDSHAHAQVKPIPFGRFGSGPTANPTEAPVRFGWWQPSAHAPDQPGPAWVASTTEEGGLVERVLAAGFVVGRGHLLFLGYSPFEQLHGDAKGWDEAPGMQDVLGGLQMIERLYYATEELLGRLSGPVLAVEQQPNGGVRVTVVEPLGSTDDARLESMIFSSENVEIVAPLVDFHVERREMVYAIPARELSDKLKRCTSLVSKQLGVHEPIHVCPPEREAGTSGEMDAATSLQLLARYTGGSDDPSKPTVGTLHTRPLGLGWLSLIFLVAWGRRAMRRLQGMAARRQMRGLEQLVQRRYDPPDAVVAAAGDWDGRTSTWPRVGSFAGFRPLEAGDRPSAIVLQDLVLAEQGGPQLLPRVVQRIEEASPSAVVFVNLGESMRVPGQGDDSKAMFAGRVALHIAASAWKIRGEVSIQGIGIRGDGEIIEPMGLSPGYDELADNLRARLRQRPQRDEAPWPDELPECGAVVLISDFQLEDEQALQRWIDRLEGASIRVGGVMVYSPLEFTMIEGGRLAGSRIWADRADWDPDDVFAAFSRRRDVIERIFDSSTTGGLVVAATHFTQDDIEVALASGRLLQILR